MSDELRQRAEAELAKIPPGRVTDRERYLEAIMRRLEREQASHPTASTGSAQAATISRQEAARRPLPPPATPEQVAASKPWLAKMRAALGRPANSSKQGASW